MTRPTDIVSTTCGDCGCREGELHSWGCDMEECPLCGGQLLSCACREKFPTEDALLAAVSMAGRVRFIRYPSHCARCGETWPAMWMVPDEEWEHYIPMSKRGEQLCRPCYDRIKGLIDAGEAVDGRYQAIAKCGD